MVSLRVAQPDAEEQAHREIVALITALEGHRDCHFVLQWVGTPDLDLPEAAVIQVSLITTVTGSGEGPDVARVIDVADDVADLLAAPPRRWVFAPVGDSGRLAEILLPCKPTHLAELARREEPLAPIRWTSGVGFGEYTARMPLRSQLWSMWTLGPPFLDTRRLAVALLAQEAPVCLRMILSPSGLEPGERAALETLVAESGADSSSGGLYRASLSTLESLLYLRPLFDTRCLVASPEPLSRSLLSLIGHAVSAPMPHAAPPQPILQGGYAVIREADAGPTVLRTAYEGLSPGEPAPSLAPAILSRQRRLLGSWEAANLFRLPVAIDAVVPGMSVDERPFVEPLSGDLPRSGLRLGALASHPSRGVFATAADRLRHTYVAGQTGTGKSTLLLNLALQDIATGDGVAVIDPHGDLVEALLARIPEERRVDVVLVDPADPVAVVGVNLLEAESVVQQQYIIAELSNLFYALFDPAHKGIVGPRFETMLRQAALLLLHVKDTPASFLDISTVFSDPAVRHHLTQKITDPVLAEFWLGEFSQTNDFHRSEVLGWFRSKFEVFRTSTLLRNVVGQASSSISFTGVMRERRILLVNLSKGALGEYNSALLGQVILMRLWAAALERATKPDSQRPNFFVYIDEFQNVTTESLPAMLSEARKYRVGFTLANQFFSQLHEATRDALMGNVGSKLAFRLGPKDASLFARWLGEGLNSDALAALPNHTLVAALSPGGSPAAPILVSTDPPGLATTSDRADAVRALSRDRWARPVAEVEFDFRARWSSVPGSFSYRIAHEPEVVERQQADDAEG